MRKSAFIVLLASTFYGMLAVGACAGIISHEETIRYRMTVTLETPEGDKVGSTVREAFKHTEKSILPEQGGTSYGIGKGQAITFDLGKAGTLFALKAGQEEPKFVFAHLKPGDASIVALDVTHYPMIVRFSDPKNPDSYQVLFGPDSCDGTGRLVTRDNCITGDHFQEILGAGYRIKSIYIQLSNDPISTGITSIMPHYDGKYHYIHPGTLYSGD